MISKEYKKKVSKGSSHWLGRETSISSFIQFLKDNYSEISNLAVLDAGCAQGEHTAFLGTYGLLASGIDYNKGFIEEAKKSHPDISFSLGSIEDMPYESESFDAVYCVNTLFYTDPENSLPEIERLVKKGGLLYITLDEKIVNEDEDKIIHDLDVNIALENFSSSRIISKKYFERKDTSPFNHVHHYYEIVLKKD